MNIFDYNSELIPETRILYTSIRNLLLYTFFYVSVSAIPIIFSQLLSLQNLSVQICLLLHSSTAHETRLHPNKCYVKLPRI